MSIISERLKSVESNIQSACARAGRNREEVTLIAVSKTKPIEDIREAIGCGCTCFGENKVQELREKALVLNESIQWHLIGHLQVNKVKYLPGITALIHSVDSEKLALEIDRQAQKHGIVMDVLCEVNVAGEESKFGMRVSETPELIKKITDECKNLRVKGLMTVAPRTEDPESNRPHFRTLRELLSKTNASLAADRQLTELSMGMSGDYEVAIEEGATFIRVGSSIFGPRSYEVAEG